MAGSITDAKENGLVLGSRLLQGFWAPGIPIYRVVCVLEQVRRGFIYEFIRHFFV
jgi:hypothetical protein